MSRVSGVVERVRVMLLRGGLGPVGRVADVQLAARLHVGRSTVREALRRLEGEETGSSSRASTAWPARDPRPAWARSTASSWP